VECCAVRCSLQAQAGVHPQRGGWLLMGMCVSWCFTQGANALTYNELQNLTYMQVKGTGIANTCPVVEGAAAPLKLAAGDYKLGKMCLEPTSFTVKEESQFKGGEDEFVPTKLMTRLTYTLDEVGLLLVVACLLWSCGAALSSSGLRNPQQLEPLHSPLKPPALSPEREICGCAVGSDSEQRR
jgi:hypothetical protein